MADYPDDDNEFSSKIHGQIMANLLCSSQVADEYGEGEAYDRFAEAWNNLSFGFRTALVDGLTDGLIDKKIKSKRQALSTESIRPRRLAIELRHSRSTCGSLDRRA